MVDLWSYCFYTLFLIFTLISSKVLINPVGNYNPTKKFDVVTPGVFFFIIIYSLIIGLRYKVGTDWATYSKWYNELILTGKFPVDNDFSFIWLNKLLAHLHLESYSLFIILAFLQIFFLILSLQKFPFLRTWYFFFFFTTLLFFTSLNTMRQTLAFFIFFYSLNLYLEKKYVKTILLAVLALSIHKTVIILIVLLPLLSYDWFKKIYIQIGLYGASIFIFPKFFNALIDFISPFANMLGYGYYISAIDFINQLSDQIRQGAGAGTGIYFFIMVDLVIIIFSSKLKNYFSRYNFTVYYNLYFTGILLSYVFYNNFVFYRIAEYFIYFRALILSFLCFYLINTRSKIKGMHGTVLVGIFVICFILYFYKAIYNNVANCVPFQLIF